MRLHQFFEKKAASGEPLVLATVFETVGSTYSKAGGQMLIDGDGNFCGMLSGGCLEGDLAERAKAVIETGAAAIASYDLGADDELWGLGVGCDGNLRVMLQPLMPESGYQPFAAIDDILRGGKPLVIAIVIETESSSIEAGASVVLSDGDALCFGMSGTVASSIAGATNDPGLAAAGDVMTSAGHCRVLFADLAPAPSLLIMGAGPDSEPVARIAAELDWRCTVADHRPAYIESRCYPGETRKICCPAGEVNTAVDLAGFDLALVMSHHLASDRAYLRQVANSDIGYIGLLGPPGRRDRLMNDLPDVAGILQDRLHGPAGLQLGGRGPGPIALSIVAEMQGFLSR